RRHAGDPRDATSRVRADRRALEGAHASELDVAGEAEAERTAVLSGAEALLREALVVGHLERPAEDGGIVAAVVHDVAGAAIVRQPDVVGQVGWPPEVGGPDIRSRTARLSA